MSLIFRNINRKLAITTEEYSFDFNGRKYVIPINFKWNGITGAWFTVLFFGIHRWCEKYDYIFAEHDFLYQRLVAFRKIEYNRKDVDFHMRNRMRGNGEFKQKEIRFFLIFCRLLGWFYPLKRFINESRGH